LGLQSSSVFEYSPFIPIPSELFVWFRFRFIECSLIMGDHGCCLDPSSSATAPWDPGDLAFCVRHFDMDGSEAIRSHESYVVLICIVYAWCFWDARWNAQWCVVGKQLNPQDTVLRCYVMGLLPDFILSNWLSNWLHLDMASNFRRSKTRGLLERMRNRSETAGPEGRTGPAGNGPHCLTLLSDPIRKLAVFQPLSSNMNP
jgi:hypothetical protein